MQKILVCFLQPLFLNNLENIGIYYESFINELKNAGNDILIFNMINENLLPPKQKEEWLEEQTKKIKEFNPDIIFTFNNRISEGIINSTNCPIVLYEADLFDYYVNKELIAKYKDRYYALTFNDFNIDGYINLGFERKNIIVLHAVTSVKPEKLEKVNNISFIGTNFPIISKESHNNILSYGDGLYKMFLDFWKSGNYNYDDLLKKYLPDVELSAFDKYALFDSRVYILNSLLDLGLKLYGVRWDILPPEFIILKSAFDRTSVFSLKHNQDIYNSSVINLSVSHPQCIGNYFPWRIYDIMASDGVLVTQYSSHLKNITKGFVDIPMFENPFDARELCKKILNDKSLREDIIAKSNQFIDKFGRWNDNLKKISEVINVDFLSYNNLDKSNVDIIKYDIYSKSDNVKFKYKMYLKLYYKLQKKLERKGLINY